MRGAGSTRGWHGSDFLIGEGAGIEQAGDVGVIQVVTGEGQVRAAAPLAVARVNAPSAAVRQCHTRTNPLHGDAGIGHACNPDGSANETAASGYRAEGGPETIGMQGSLNAMLNGPKRLR